MFWGYIPLHSPYIGLIYGRYLQFGFVNYLVGQSWMDTWVYYAIMLSYFSINEYIYRYNDIYIYIFVSTHIYINQRRKQFFAVNLRLLILFVVYAIIPLYIIKTPCRTYPNQNSRLSSAFETWGAVVSGIAVYPGDTLRCHQTWQRKLIHLWMILHQHLHVYNVRPPFDS